MDLASGYSDSSANPFGYVNNAVAQNQANMLANYNANLAYVGGQNQAALNNNFNNFGQQTDYYSALGAAYGRNTGYYGDTGNAYPGGYPSGNVQRGPDLPDLSLPSSPFVGGGMTYDQYGNVTGYTGGGQPTANAPGSSGSNPLAGALWQGTNSGYNAPAMGSVFDQGAAPIMNYGADNSWLGAGGTQNPYNPFGQINSGQVGNYNLFAGGGSYGGGINYDQYGNVTSYGVPAQAPNMQSTLGYTPDQYLNGPNYAGAGQFDPNSFANRFAAGGYYHPGTPSQISGYAPNGYDPLSGQQAPYTYQPGFVQGPGGPGDWVPQQIPGMNTLSPNDMKYQQSYNGM